MAAKRVVDTSFWTDDVVEEKFTPEDRYFMLWLMTNPSTTQLGIYHISVRHAALELGYSEDTVNYLLERFDKTYGIIIWSKKTREVAIKNYLRHSIVAGGVPVEHCLKREMEKVKNQSLIDSVFRHISQYPKLNKTVVRILEEHEYIIANEDANENVNANANAESGDESYHDSGEPPEPPEPKKPVKHKYGEYKHVLLTDDEVAKLGAEFGEELTDEAVVFLDEYIEMKGYKAKSHYLVIRKWVIDAVNEQRAKQQRQMNQNSGRLDFVDKMQL